jgi:hypothetical protein
MQPSYGLIRQIKCAAAGQVGAKSIGRSVELIEATTPIGALMASVAPREFTPVMLDAARGRPREEALAWLTLAAAGPVKTRLALAGRAVDLVDPEALIEVLLKKGGTADPCRERAEQADGDEQWGAWLLLSRLRRSELRRLVDSRPKLHRLYSEAKRANQPVNPQLAGQLEALGLL